MKNSIKLRTLLEDLFMKLRENDEQFTADGPFLQKDLDKSILRKRAIKFDEYDLYLSVTLRKSPPESHYCAKMLVSTVYITYTEVAESGFPELAIGDLRRIIARDLQKIKPDQKSKLIDNLIKILEDRNKD